MTGEKQATKKYLSATVYYLLTAFVFSWFAFFNLGTVLPFWQKGVTMTPQSLGIIHTFILGFMLTVALGVFYQFIPIAFQAPPIGRHVLYWHLPIHCLSVIIMIVGFWQLSFPTVATGGSLLLCSTLAFLFIVLQSYRKAKNKTIVHKGLTVPLAILLVVMLFGIWMAAGLPGVGAKMLGLHVFLGAFAFWAGLVIVISYKFIPMFTLSHGYKISQKTTLLLYFTGIAIIFIAMILPGSINELAVNIMEDLGSVVALAALIKFIIDMYKIVRARKRKSIVLPIRYSLVALGIITSMGILMMFVILFHLTAWIETIAYVMLLCGFVPLIFSYTQKIVPFLWYEYRYSQRPERKQAPLIDEMVSKTKAKWSMNLYYLGTIVGLIGFLTGGNRQDSQLTAIHILNPIAALICLFAAILLFTALVRVLTIGGPRPRD